ncbi:MULTISPECIES: isochorismatase family protein [Rhizobium]|uniref:isochorismatase family protein n=1 Tax=Rhizobium TaxID=379 RepID=UPI001FF07C52|nr:MULTISPECIES: isochorismatase family protein [Rhizobium]
MSRLAGKLAAGEDPLGAFELRSSCIFAPSPEETVIRKTKDDGFDGTDLDAILTAFGVHDLVICGVPSEMCVAATARAALERGYGVLLLHDAPATDEG